jgi:hypothetical protein
MSTIPQDIKDKLEAKLETLSISEFDKLKADLIATKQIVVMLITTVNRLNKDMEELKNGRKMDAET